MGVEHDEILRHLRRIEDRPASVGRAQEAIVAQMREVGEIAARSERRPAERTINVTGAMGAGPVHETREQ